MAKISDSVSMALNKAGKRQKDLAAYWGKSKQNMSVKMVNDAFFADDLVDIAKFTGGRLAFIYQDGTVINIDKDPDMTKKRNQKKKSPDTTISED